MKTVLTKIFALGGVALFMLSACKKDGALVTSNGGKPGTLAASATTLVLDKTKLTDGSAVITFTVAKANYGFSAAITNILQIDAASDNWANPTTVTLSNTALSQGYSTADFNNMLLKLNLLGGVSAQVQARVKQSISANVTAVYSNVINLTVTPFDLSSFVYLPGSYEGWGNPGAAEDSLLSATSNGIYTGVIGFTAGNSDFLVVPVKGSWANKYATADGPQSSVPAVYTTQYVTGGLNNFFAPVKGTVDPAVNITRNKVTLNTNANTLTLVPTQWSVVGDATPGNWPAGSGYQSDTDMAFNNATQTWWVKVALTAGNIKFRLNHDWTTNYGSKTTAGVLDTNNDNNIPITVAGTYLITVDIAHLTYSLVKQ